MIYNYIFPSIAGNKLNLCISEVRHFFACKKLKVNDGKYFFTLKYFYNKNIIDANLKLDNYNMNI